MLMMQKQLKHMAIDMRLELTPKFFFVRENVFSAIQKTMTMPQYAVQ